MRRGPTTPKGFRDIDPKLAKKRQIVLRKITDVLEQYGFSPIETPTIEFAQTLKGKYGEEERLIYEFEDRGGRRLALRYDLTVPLARYIANNLGVLSPTFSRYQIGQVFRGENPQKGRYREFTQFDFDVAGSSDLRQDARVIKAALECVKALGFKKAKMLINDRNIFKDLKIEFIRQIDKLQKIGEAQVINQLVKMGASKKFAFDIISNITQRKPTKLLLDIFSLLYQEGLEKGKDFDFDPSLVRGLDYYTSTVFELKPSANPRELSIGGGGRYDNLLGMFSGRQIPAVGFSFGIDRIVDLL